MNNLVFGKYIPMDTPIHRLDPRAKIIAMLIMLVAIFIPSGFLGYLVLAIFILFVLLLAKLRFKFIIKAFKPMTFMMIFLFVINILSVKEGDLWLSLGFIEIYSEAIIDTLYIVVRLLLMIMVTTCLIATTKPLDLTLGIEYLLVPLKRFKVPAHEIAIMISLALRFIPLIIEETMRIMNSQKSRGVDFEEGKLKEKIMAILSLIVPLFSVAFQRADELANAMEARGYVPGKERTKYKLLKYHFGDFLLLAMSLSLMGAMILMNIYL